MAEQVFKHILLIGRQGIAGVAETLTTLQKRLRKQGVNVLIEANTAEFIDPKNNPIVEGDQIPEACDLIIVVGGDGSLLTAAHMATKRDLPVLGINRGRLGFLTDIHPEELQQVDAVIHGDYIEEKRFLLDASLHYQSEKIAQDTALNDVVLLPGDVAQMIEFETFIDNQFVCRQRADGLIVASPTGSTAYALSGGGPILHPCLDAIVLVPMFPHTLSSRPIVIDGNSCIEILIAHINDISPYVSCDAHRRISAPPGSRLRIEKRTQHLRLIHPKSYNYFATLREKLGWERHAMRA